MHTHISLTIHEDVAYVTLACDETGKPPTLDHPALDELIVCTKEIAAGGRLLRAVIVQSDSPKYFCVGANIDVLKTLNAETIVPWIEHGHTALNMLEALPLPVIARVDGYALGGGLELAMACDLIVAARSAKLGQTEARLGVVAGWGGSARLPIRVGQARAKDLSFTGRFIEAEEALRIGLVQFVGESDDLAGYVDALLNDIRQCSPLAVSEMKHLLSGSRETTIDANRHAETAASVVCLSDAETRERIASYLERRKKT